MYYTLKQACERLEVTRPTIRKYFKELPEDIQSAEGKTVMNSLMLSEKALQLIAEKIGKKLENEPENTETNSENDEKIAEKADKTIEILEKTLENLQNQLAAKDKQIDQLQILLNQQQQLTMASNTKIVQLEEQLQKPEPEQKKKRFLFW